MAPQTKSILDQIRIASPCEAAWNEMVGDERCRLCSACNLHVYNISEMSRSEAEALLLKTSVSDEQTCIRLYRRPDGTVLTRDCRIGVASQRSRNRSLLVAMVCMIASGLSCIGLGAIAQRIVSYQIGTDDMTEIHVMGACIAPISIPTGGIEMGDVAD